MGWQYQRMKILDKKGIQAIVMEFSENIQRGDVSEDWLHEYLQQLPEHWKDPSQVSSYRITMLQNVYGQLRENIVAKMIVIYLEAEGMQPDTLGSYRPGKVT